MCLSPIPIKEKGGNLRIIHDTKKYGIIDNTYKTDKYGIHQSRYMLVPCNHCSQCIAIAQMEMVQRIQMEAMKNTLYFATITYKEEALPRYETPYIEDEKSGELREGYNYRYFEYRDLQDTLRRMRDNNVYGIPFRYLAVTERGSERARPHAHIIFSFRNEDIGKDYLDKINFQEEMKWKLLENWKRPIPGSRKKYPLYMDLCEYHEKLLRGKWYRNYDFHYINPRTSKEGITDAAFYVLKYMFKNSAHEEKIRQALKLNYDEVVASELWEKLKSRRKYSLGFGLNPTFEGKNREITENNVDQDIVKYLRDCIERSKKHRTEYAYYYPPEKLLTFPLANYYKRFGFIYNSDDEDFFYNVNPERYRNRYLMPERPSESEIAQQVNKFNKIAELQQLEDCADNFDELFNL